MKLMCFLAVAVFGFTPSDAPAATFAVSNLGDSGSGSLRQVILDANAASGNDTITFLVSGTITLASALPAVTGSTTITGPGTNLLTISGDNSVNIFTFNSGTTNTISGLTIANGMATNYVNGAGIANLGNLTISNCALVDNGAFGGWGGAVFNSSLLVIKDSMFSGNRVTGGNGFASGGGGGAGMGGALFTMSGSAVVSACRFASNSATGGNGADASFTAGSRIGRGGGTNAGFGEFNKDGGLGGGGVGMPECCKGGNGGFGGGGGGGSHGGLSQFGGGAGNGGCLNVAPGGGGGGAGIGGGIFVHSGNVTIVDCYFVGNEVVGGFGGTDFCGPARTGSPGNGIAPDFYNLGGTILPLLTATTLGGGSFFTNPVAPPYLGQSSVTVTANPSPGWTFLQWLGDASGTNPVVGLHMNRNKLVQAMFGTPLNHAPSITVAPEAEIYPYGTPVRLTAIPPDGSYFVSWMGNVLGTNNPTTFVVSSAAPDIDCEFAPLGFGESSLTVVENGRGQVVVVPAKNRYAINETVGLIAIPESGQQFLGWTGDADGKESPMLVSMIQSRFVTANFTKRPTLRVGTPLEGLVEDGFRLTLLGEFGSQHSILGTTDFLQWTPIGTVTNTYGTVQLIDPAATNLPSRFYRAVVE